MSHQLTSSSLVDDLQDLTHIDQDLDSTQRDLDGSVDMACAVEALRDVLVSTLPEGGMSYQTAVIVSKHAATILPVVGTLPALESYRDAGSRSIATQIAVESMNESLKKIWEKIVAFFKKITAFLRDFLFSSFHNADQLKQRAERLLEKSHQLVEGKILDVEIKHPSIYHRLQINGKVEAMRCHLLQMTERVFKYQAQVANTGHKVLNAVEMIKEKSNKKLDKASLTAFSNSINSLLYPFEHTRIVSNYTAEGFPELPTGLLLNRSEELPGGKAIISIQHSTAEGTGQHVGRCGATLGDYKPNRDAFDSQSLRVLSKQEMIVLCSEWIKTFELIKQHQSQAHEIVALQEKFTSLVESLVNNDVFINASQLTLEQLRAIPKQLTEPVLSYTLYAFKTGNAVLDWVAASLKEHNQS